MGMVSSKISNVNFLEWLFRLINLSLLLSFSWASHFNISNYLSTELFLVILNREKITKPLHPRRRNCIDFLQPSTSVVCCRNYFTNELTQGQVISDVQCMSHDDHLYFRKIDEIKGSEGLLLVADAVEHRGQR